MARRKRKNKSKFKAGDVIRVLEHTESSCWIQGRGPFVVSKIEKRLIIHQVYIKNLDGSTPKVLRGAFAWVQPQDAVLDPFITAARRALKECSKSET